MPKRAARSRADDAAGLDDQVAVESAENTSRSGMWIVTGTTASSGDHSIITGVTGLPVASLRQLAEEFGMAGLGKARARRARSWRSDW